MAMVTSQCQAVMGGPPLLPLGHRPWPPAIRVAGSWGIITSTRRHRLGLLQQASNFKLVASAATSSDNFRPDPAARFRMTQRTPIAPKWAVSLCDHLETAIFASDTSKSRNNPGPASENQVNYYLSDGFAPVPEMMPTTNLRVTGTIPECMDGEFMRVGPNPRFMPRGGYHWIDGDGMIHGLQLRNGKATYVARYVQTCRLQQEERYGAPKFLKVGDLKGMKGFYCFALEALRRILGVLDIGSEGALYAGSANTALVYHNNKILALDEGDKPYIIKVLEDGDLQTVGLEEFEQKLQHSFGAHPKIDPVTGEMFTIAMSPPALFSAAPQLNYCVVSKEGILGEPVTVPITSSVMHDFAITEKHAVFLDLPLVLNLMGMARGELGVKFDPRKKSRLGVLPRYATDESKIRWFTIPTCYIFHTLNAWEQGDEVVLTCCRMDGINLEYFEPYRDFDPLKIPKLCAIPVTPLLKGNLNERPVLYSQYEYRLNLRTGDVKHRQLSNLPAELPRINAEYIGRKVRYAYCFSVDYQRCGVAKFDLTLEPTGSSEIDFETGGNLVGLFKYAPGRLGGDTVFVPRNPGMAMAAEDDGYLITFVHDESTGKSEAIIIDAKTMGPEPVAVVELPQRVPHGFHALFATREQLLQQA